MFLEIELRLMLRSRLLMLLKQIRQPLYADMNLSVLTNTGSLRSYIP